MYGNSGPNPEGRCPANEEPKGTDRIGKADLTQVQLVIFQRHSPSSASELAFCLVFLA